MLKDDQLNLRVEPGIKFKLRVLAKTWSSERGQKVSMSAVVRELVHQAYRENALAQTMTRAGI